MHNSPQTKKKQLRLGRQLLNGQFEIATILDKIQPKSQYNLPYIWFCKLKFGLHANLTRVGKHVN